MRALPSLPSSPGQAAAWRRVAAVDVRAITADSREVRPGYLFAALPGARLDGRRFIADAVERGAAAILAPEGTAWPAGTPPRPLWEDPEPRRRLAEIAAMLAGTQPALSVAVTGTNGKTSTVEFLRQIWAQSGRAAASLGTLGLNAPGFAAGPGLTTPDPVALANTLAELARAGVQCVAMEASSHGLDQFRLDGVRAGGGRLHQPHARSSGLSRHAGRLSGRQAAPVRRIAARGRARHCQHHAGCRQPRRTARHRRPAPPAIADRGRRWHHHRAAPRHAAGGRAGPGGGDAAARGAKSICRWPAGSRPITPWSPPPWPRPPARMARWICWPGWPACAGGWNWRRACPTAPPSMWITPTPRMRWTGC